MSHTLSAEDIRSIVEIAKEKYDTGEYRGMCRSVATSLTNELNSRDIPAQRREFRMGDKRICHFAATMPMEYYSEVESDDGKLIIDPTISQFHAQNHFQNGVEVGLFLEENAPSVGIYPPNCEERKLWYHKRNDPREGVDPYFEEPHDDDPTAEPLQSFV